MSGNFKVGEVCIGQNYVNNLERNGMECTVVGGLEYGAVYSKKTGETVDIWTYEVIWADGVKESPTPHNLRRKQPPTGEASILNMFVVAPPKRIKEIA